MIFNCVILWSGNNYQKMVMISNVHNIRYCCSILISLQGEWLGVGCGRLSAQVNSNMLPYLWTEHCS